MLLEKKFKYYEAVQIHTIVKVLAFLSINTYEHNSTSLTIVILLNFLITVKAAPHECVIRSSKVFIRR